MTPRLKIGRNDPCPCGTGKKYKHCCEGRVDWNKIIRDGKDWRKYISIRGRNTLFLNKIAEILNLDSNKKPRSLKGYKSAFTTEVVKKIHESILEVWPPNLDIYSVLRGASVDVSGLYIGDYRTEFIIQGLVRHSIYANKILVIDPFIYPLSVRDEYNPILNPNQHRTQTLKNVNFWLNLMPWIESGIVEVIRTPADFDRKLDWESLVRQRKKFEENEELRKAAEKSVEEMEERFQEKEALRFLILSAPDSYLKRKFREFSLQQPGITEDDFIADIQKLREQDPDFLEPLTTSKENAQLHVYSSGASYDIAKLTANLTGSYLVTDIYSKWKEIEVDREEHSAENREWSPFAKAFQNMKLKYINNLKLDHALILRKEGRMESLRTFLREVWKAACSAKPFSEINAKLLADELNLEIKKAEEEWKQIDRDLLKWFGAEVSAGLLAAGPLIASGYAIFLATAFAAAGSLTLLSTESQRRSFQDKFPAAFFMKIEK